MSGYTPGPWKVGHHLQRQSNFRPVRRVTVESHEIPAHKVVVAVAEADSYPVADANAALIAAAPDLLAACRRLLAFEPSAGQNDISNEDRDFACAAIAKAEGK